MSRFYSPYYYNKQKLNCKIIMNIFENLTAFPQFRVIFTLKKQDYSCSTVSLHKPCSVLRKEWQSFIYVTTRSDHWLRFAVIRFPYQIWVSRLRGLPVPSFRFPGKLVSVALLKESAIAFATGLLQPSAYACLLYTSRCV